MNDADAINKFVAECKKKSDAGESSLSQDSCVNGMTSEKIKSFLNLVVGYEGFEHYLEIGVHQGATFIAALYNNLHIKSAVAIDNWSEFVGYGPGRAFSTKDDLMNEFCRNIEERKVHLPKIEVIDSDCWKVNLDTLPKFDVYFYDGNHSKESQHKSLTYYWDSLQDVFVYIVDDWNLEEAREGAAAALCELNIKPVALYNFIAKSASDSSNYWNGLGAYVIEK